MIKTKYYAVYYMQKLWAIGDAACDLCNFLCENLSPEESKVPSKVTGKLVLTLFEAYGEIYVQFPELRRIEVLGEMREKVKYDIKCQDVAESQEEVVRQGLSAEEADGELERYRNEHVGYSGLIWLELDGDSKNAMLEYFAVRKKEWEKQLKENRNTLIPSEPISTATPSKSLS
jgi:hypothetical protein